MSIDHKKQSASGTILTTDWDATHKITGGTVGQVPIRANNDDGHVIGYPQLLAIVTSDAEIAINTWALKISGTAPALRYSIMWNNNGTLVEVFNRQD
jgi:hypothetical protein